MADYETLAGLLGFPPQRWKIEDTGGGIEVLLLTRNDGKVIAISEDVVVLYGSGDKVFEQDAIEVALALGGSPLLDNEVLSEYTGPGNGWVKKEAVVVAEAVGGTVVPLRQRYIVAVRVQATKSDMLEVSVENPLDGIALISRHGIEVHEGLSGANWEHAQPGATIEFIRA